MKPEFHDKKSRAEDLKRLARKLRDIGESQCQSCGRTISSEAPPPYADCAPSCPVAEILGAAEKMEADLC